VSIVYKYRKPNRSGWSILENGALFLSPPNKFNDQKDMRQRLPRLFDSDREVIIQKLAQISRQQDPTQTEIDILRETCLALDQGGLLEDLRSGELGQSLVDQVRQEAGVVCFGTDADNTHLWKEYSGGGMGFCLGFSTRHLGKKAHQVSYENDPRHEKLRYFESSREEIRRALCLMKDEVWKEEREVRIIVPRAAGQLLHFAPEALVSVAIGERVRKSDSFKIYRLVKGKYPHAQVQVRGR